MDAAPLHEQLGRELDLLLRVVDASRLQHRRALYFHRLCEAQKRMTHAHKQCGALQIHSPAAGVKPALAAIERALDALPDPLTKFRNLLAQTYFMPLALTCLAILSRSALLLARLHAILLASQGSIERTAATPMPVALLALLPDRHHDVPSRHDTTAPVSGAYVHAEAAQPSPGASGTPLTTAEEEDLGEPTDGAAYSAVGSQQESLDGCADVAQGQRAGKATGGGLAADILPEALFARAPLPPRHSLAQGNGFQSAGAQEMGSSLPMAPPQTLGNGTEAATDNDLLLSSSHCEATAQPHRAGRPPKHAGPSGARRARGVAKGQLLPTSASRPDKRRRGTTPLQRLLAAGSLLHAHLLQRKRQTAHR